MELVNEWIPKWKFIKVDTPFKKDSTYEKELMYSFPLTWNDPHKSEMEYHGKFGHTLGWIQHIAIMIIIDIYYTDCRLATQTVLPILNGFQGTKRCIRYLDIYPRKTILFPSNYYDVSNFIRVTWSGNQVEYWKIQNFL